MSTLVGDVEPRRSAIAVGGPRYDALIAIMCAVFQGGAYLDLWAHVGARRLVVGPALVRGHRAGWSLSWLVASPPSPDACPVTHRENSMAPSVITREILKAMPH